MLPIELHYGVIVDNDDPLRLGRMQVRILPELEGVRKEHLPWLEPFNGGEGAFSLAQEKEFFEENSPVWCFFSSKTFKRGWYISGIFLEKRFNFDAIPNTLNEAISEFNVGEYRDLVFSRDRLGTVQFRNTRTGVMGIFHNSGSYVVYSAAGDITAYSKKSIRLYNDQNEIVLKDSPGIEINASSGSINFNGSENTLVKYSELASILDFLIENLNSRIYPVPTGGMTSTVFPTHIHTTFDPLYNQKKNNMNASDLKTQ